MLVHDEAKLAALAEEVLVDQYMERLEKLRELTLGQAIWIDTADDPTDLKRVAKGMLTEDFERKLHKLNPRLRFATLPLKTDKRCVWVEDAAGTAFPISSYEAGWIPESSLRRRETEIIKNSTNVMKVKNGKVFNHFERADFPKSEWNPETQEFDFAGLCPNEEKIEVPWTEVKRGYRTVLLYLLEAGELDLDQVEREFGAGDTRGWAVHTGRQTSLVGTPS